MLTAILYSSIAAILLAGIDAWRINRVKGRVANINHTVSALLGAGAFPLVWVLSGGEIVWVIPTLKMLIVIAVYFCIRGILYDPALNIFRRLPLDYISRSTSSQIDQRLSKVHFWRRRALYGAGLAIVLLINYFL